MKSVGGNGQTTVKIENFNILLTIISGLKQ